MAPHIPVFVLEAARRASSVEGRNTVFRVRVPPVGRIRVGRADVCELLLLPAAH